MSKPNEITRGLWSDVRGRWVDHPELNAGWVSGSPYGQPRATCPFCGCVCEAEYVDNGIGQQQITPFGCEGCHAYEQGPFDDAGVQATRHGWYLPEAPAPGDKPPKPHLNPGTHISIRIVHVDAQGERSPECGLALYDPIGSVAGISAAIAGMGMTKVTAHLIHVLREPEPPF